MDPEHKITKKEKKELRKLEWQEKAKATQSKEQMKKYSIWAGVVAVIVLVIGGLFWVVSAPPPTSSGPNTNIPDISSKDMTTGNPKSKVEVIEYGDFQCPACGLAFPTVKQLLAEDKDKIKFSYRFFPLISVHPNAFAADLAAYAAFKQGKFWEYHDILYSKQIDWSNLSDPTDSFLTYAKSLNLDSKKFATDMKSDDTKKYVQDSEDAGTSQGINSTPTFFVNKRMVQNWQSLDEFKKLINEELSAK